MVGSIQVRVEGFLCSWMDPEMKACTKFLTYLLLAGITSANAVTSRTAEENIALHEQVKFVGDACSINVSEPSNWKRIKYSPAFFWYTSHVALYGEPSDDQKRMIKSAVSCSAPLGIIVDETKVRNGLAKLKSQESSIQAGSR